MSLSVPVMHALFAVPHAPFTGLSSVHAEVVPPPIPVQLHLNCVAVSPVSFSVPVVHALFVVPQMPLTGIISEQLASVPPLLPLHVHK